MINPKKELEKYGFDPAKLKLENLTAHLPAYFKSPTGNVYQWACIPCQTGWSVNVYICKEAKVKVLFNGNDIRWERHMAFTHPKIVVAICRMLLWLLQDDIVSYHQLIELL